MDSMLYNLNEASLAITNINIRRLTTSHPTSGKMNVLCFWIACLLCDGSWEDEREHKPAAPTSIQHRTRRYWALDCKNESHSGSTPEHTNMSFTHNQLSCTLHWAGRGFLHLSFLYTEGCSIAHMCHGCS